MSYKQKSSGGLAGLIGKRIRPMPGMEHLWDGTGRITADRGAPFEKGCPSAEITAAFTERQRDGTRVLKVAAVSPAGRVGEFYLAHVLLEGGGKTP